LQDTSLDAVDQRWTQQLSRQVRSANVGLAAEFAVIPLTVRQLMKLKVNDVLPVDIPKTITAHAGSVPVMECTYGTFNGRYALRVQKVLAHSEPELKKNTSND